MGRGRWTERRGPEDRRAPWQAVNQRRTCCVTCRADPIASNHVRRARPTADRPMLPGRGVSVRSRQVLHPIDPSRIDSDRHHVPWMSAGPIAPSLRAPSSGDAIQLRDSLGPCRPRSGVQKRQEGRARLSGWRIVEPGERDLKAPYGLLVRFLASSRETSRISPIAR